MFSWLANAWRVPELRKRVLFTALILALYRLGSWIPAPGVDQTAISSYFNGAAGNGVFGLLNLFSGSALSLARLEKHSQLLVPLDRTHDRYRWQRPFADAMYFILNRLLDTAKLSLQFRNSRIGGAVFHPVLIKFRFHGCFLSTQALNQAQGIRH